MSTRVAVLMASYREPALAATLEGLRAFASELGSVRVFLVDDGGSPPVAVGSLPATSSSFSIVVARHVVNLGQGAALETARQLAMREAPFDVYVTMDADGQHRAQDIAALVAAIAQGADVALGDRFAGGSRVPRGRVALLAAARLFERWLIGRALGDAHNGLRAFRWRALRELQISQNRMAHATEIVRIVLDPYRGFTVVEVPVHITYTDASLQKGQRSAGALTIASDLFDRYLFGARER